MVRCSSHRGVLEDLEFDLLRGSRTVDELEDIDFRMLRCVHMSC
jgi:hypothetical protein